MISFFELAEVIAVAEHAYVRGGEDHAALVWQLAGAPVLSPLPEQPDGPQAQVYDHQWLARRWPGLTVADLATEPSIHQHYTAEVLPLADHDQLLAALHTGAAEGWTHLAVDVGEMDLSWFLTRTRQRKPPKKPLGRRERRSQHPVVSALSAAGFTIRNFPPGLDHWRCEGYGPRYQALVSVTTVSTEITCLHASSLAVAWHARIRADVPADVTTTIATALVHITDPPTPIAAPAKTL